MTSSNRAVNAAAAVRGLTLADAVSLRVPLVYVVEQDPIWADAALVTLLEEFGQQALQDVDGPAGTVPTAARWSRTRGWQTLGNPLSYSVLVQQIDLEDVARRDVVEDLLRLTVQLHGGRDPGGNATHVLNGALLWMRGLGAELEREIVVEALFDLVGLLKERDATLLIEVDAPLEAKARASRLGPSFRLPETPSIRYRAPLAELRDAIVRVGSEMPDAAALVAQLRGLSQLQAELVARLVAAEVGMAVQARAPTDGVGSARWDGDVMALIAAGRDRVQGSTSA